MATAGAGEEEGLCSAHRASLEGVSCNLGKSFHSACLVDCTGPQPRGAGGTGQGALSCVAVLMVL